ncbi:MAG: hypothetical protein AMJ90_01565, partial [candidate division Zixibacteria bacterium SM23_73_2]
MKKVMFIFFVFIFIAFSSLAFAEIPKYINFQGVLKDSNNVPQTGSYQITFSIWNQSLSGSQLWDQTLG